VHASAGFKAIIAAEKFFAFKKFFEFFFLDDFFAYTFAKSVSLFKRQIRFPRIEKFIDITLGKS
jgi:hypothetical protein